MRFFCLISLDVLGNNSSFSCNANYPQLINILYAKYWSEFENYITMEKISEANSNQVSESIVVAIRINRLCSCHFKSLIFDYIGQPKFDILN